MLQEEEKVVAAPEESEKQEEPIVLTPAQVKELKETGRTTVEVEDVDAGLTDKNIEEVREATKKEVELNHVLNPEQQEIFLEMCEEAKQPFVITDGKFKLGEKELDIRYLSKKNLDQMMFRTGVLQNVYLKQILSTLVDIMRLSMIIADKIGVEDIIQATDDIVEKTEKQHNFKATKKTEEPTEETGEGNKA